MSIQISRYYDEEIEVDTEKQTEKYRTQKTDSGSE